MNKTQIEWVRNPDGTQGYTWNPITGCLNGCEYCYARRLAKGRLRQRYLANSNLPCHDEPNHEVHHSDPFYPRFWKEKVEGYSLTNSWRCDPKGIFVCDMSDLFGIGIPKDWTRRVLDKISYGAYKLHRFYLLTKHPENLPKFSPFPPNVYLGVSVTNQQMFDTAIHYLKMVDAKVKFLSFEPLLNHIIVDKS